MTFNEFVDTQAGATWIASTEFDQRCVELFARLERGERISLQAAANMVGMPLHAFAETYFEFRRGFLAYQREIAAAANTVRH